MTKQIEIYNENIQDITFYFIFLNIGISSAMVPDEEALKDPKFVAQHGCLTDHFVIKDYFLKEEWQKALDIIYALENKGCSDRSLSVAKGKIYFKLFFYQKSLDSFNRALQEKYKCDLAVPRILTAVPFPDYLDDGRVWCYLYQTYLSFGGALLHKSKVATNKEA